MLDLRNAAPFFRPPPSAARDRSAPRADAPARRTGLGMLLGAVLSLPALAADLPAPLGDADFHAFDPQKAEIGRLLFFDPVLSGNGNIACATCHHPDLGTGDGLSLGIGEGGTGLGTTRMAPDGSLRIHARIPRNAPALWNLAHRELRNMFHDGRLEISDEHGNGYRSPAGEWLPEGLETLIAAQAMFPITAEHEMAGNAGENDIADKSGTRIDSAWPVIAARVAAIPEYADMFAAAFDGVDGPENLTIVEIGNALAAYIGTEFRSHDSPFDAYLAGDHEALDEAQTRGMDLFFGEAGCSDCHSGPLLSDQEFHALALPQFGPGRTRAFDPIPRDVGRMGETEDLDDIYRFRTPALRNVALTGPWGHNGAMPTLDAMVRHHLDPVASLAAWTEDMAGLPVAAWLQDTDFAIRRDKAEMRRQLARLDITPHPMSDAQVADIVAFLHALTGKTARAPSMGIPESVPSGLPVD